MIKDKTRGYLTFRVLKVLLHILTWDYRLGKILCLLVPPFSHCTFTQAAPAPRLIKFDKTQTMASPQVISDPTTSLDGSRPPALWLWSTSNNPFRIRSGWGSRTGLWRRSGVLGPSVAVGLSASFHFNWKYRNSYAQANQTPQRPMDDSQSQYPILRLAVAGVVVFPKPLPEIPIPRVPFNGQLNHHQWTTKRPMLIISVAT